MSIKKIFRVNDWTVKRITFWIAAVSVVALLISFWAEDRGSFPEILMFGYGVGYAAWVHGQKTGSWDRYNDGYRDGMRGKHSV